MSQWVDRFRSHTIWQLMQDLGSVIDKAVGQENAVPQVIEGLERVRTILTFAGKRLAGADPQLVPLSSLDNISNPLQSAFSEVQAFITDGDAAHIVSANSHSDSILVQLPTINYPFVTDDWNALKDSSIAYRDSLINQLGQVQTRNHEIVTETQAALSKLNSDSARQEQRLSDLAEEIGTERSRLLSLASDFQSQFSSAQETRNREFADSQTSRQDKFASLIADYNQRLTDQNAEFSNQRGIALEEFADSISTLKREYQDAAGDILNQIENHRIEVEKLVGVIGNLGVTSGYLNAANTAKKMTWLWQGITLAAMIGLIFIAYKAFLPVVQGAFSWESFAGRVFVSLTVGVLAAYAAAQADKYQEFEKGNRKLALELEAIGPYLAPLSPEMQEQFRLKLGERTFGRDDSNLSRNQDKSPATLVDLVTKSKEFQEVITTTVKALGK